MEITSLDNKKVKYWLKLKIKKYRDQENSFLIEGDHLVNEALKRNLVKEIIALDNSFQIPKIPFYLINESIMKKLSSQISPSKVIAVCTKIPDNNLGNKICILDNIQDPGNLGTIIRSAVAFNFETLILSPDTVDLYNEKTIRASEGMLFKLNFIKSDLKKIINELKSKNYVIYGTDVTKGISLKNLSSSLKEAIIIGNEGNGMQEELKLYCDNLLNIPLNSSCESLNAGVAASIIMYELGTK